MRGDDWDRAVVAKYRATWQFKQALKIISPVPQHRADCETDIVGALVWVETFRGVYSRRSPAELRKLLQKLTKTLHGAVNLADQLSATAKRNL